MQGALDSKSKELQAAKDALALASRDAKEARAAQQKNDDGHKQKARYLEDRLRSLAKQHDSFRKQITQQMVAREKELQQLRRENEELKRGVANGAPNGHDGQSRAAELALTKRRCGTLLKERDAVLAILENKVKKLTDVLAHKVLKPMQPHQASTTVRGEVRALQQLVNAAIVALQNARRSDV